jgi:formylglycine-generating enzyme required for sulfatase activity
MVDVFISYPRVEKPNIVAAIAEIRDRLRTLELSLFYDLDDIDAGATFPKVIEENVYEAKLVLGCWTKYGLTREWLLIECDIAKKNDKLIAVALEPIDRLPALFHFVNTVELYNFDTTKDHPNWTKILISIGKKLGRPGLGSFDKIVRSGDVSQLAAWVDKYPGDPLSQTVRDLATRLRVTQTFADSRNEQQESNIGRAESGKVYGQSVTREKIVNPALERTILTQHSASVLGTTDRPQDGETFRDNGAAPEMVVVPQGTFMMGSRADTADRLCNEMPAHMVTIRESFAISKFAVTKEEWSSFFEATQFPNHAWQSPGFQQDGRHPVVNVSWLDVVSYIEWLTALTGHTYRLPTEAEWEYTCRARSESAYSFGETILPDQANFGREFRAGPTRSGLFKSATTAVGTFSSNGFGVFDMHGNVWEWVADVYQENFAHGPINGSAVSGRQANRVIKGGSWASSPRQLRSASRLGVFMGIRCCALGFRVARSL